MNGVYHDAGEVNGGAGSFPVVPRQVEMEFLATLPEAFRTPA
jgi:hypothetical protein